MSKIIVVAILTVFVASRAHAAPITVSAGDFLTFNFDLSGATPPPPYSLASMNVNLEGLDFAPPPCNGPNGECELLDIGEWRLYTELDGAGDLFFVYPVNLNATFQPEMHDGVFSATLQMFDGSITVDPVACGVTADGARTPDCPPAPPPPVPEPATMTLLASGAAAAMLARRRKRRARTSPDRALVSPSSSR